VLFAELLDPPAPAAVGPGSVSLSLRIDCTTTRPLHTRFANIFGAAISEATMRPNPRWRPPPRRWPASAPSRWGPAACRC
jgi:hypothetical protein